MPPTPRRVPPPGRTIAVGKERIFLREVGSGQDALVLLHGLGSHGYSFRHILDPLARAGWRVLVPDLPGAGGSGPPSRGFSLNHKAAFLDAFLDATGAGRAVLLGHSLGASLAIRMRSTHPERVRGLVLEAGGCSSPHIPFLRKVLGTPIAGEILGWIRGRWLIRKLARDRRRSLGRLPDRWVEEHYAPVAPWAGWRMLLRTARSCDSARARRATEEAFASMPAAPLLCVWGDRDDVWPIEEVRALLEAQVARASAAGMPARLLVIPSAGHAPHEERPREFLDAVVPFLQMLRGRRADGV